MQPSPLIFIDYYVESLRFQVQDEFDPEEDEPLQTEDLTFDLRSGGYEPNQSPREAAFRMELGLEQGPRFAYTFSLVLVGLFRVDESVKDEMVLPLLGANAPALLYGAAREYLSATLGRGPHRPPFLPSVNFLNLQRLPAKALGESTGEAAITSGEADAKSSAPKPKRAAKSRANKAEQQ